MILPPTIRITNLKVLMMGGRHCGKTSTLASIFHQMVTSPINEYLIGFNKSSLSNWKHSLMEKRLQLEKFLQKGGDNTFLVDHFEANQIWDYTLELKIPGSNNRMDIQFFDIPGNLFHFGGFHSLQIINYIGDCDVFLVVVDTPYIMVGSEIEAVVANQIDSIHQFLMQANYVKTKQVIFVPVKCEKWTSEGRIDEVTAAVEHYYSKMINYLKSCKAEISIIPIHTVGDILFSDLRNPYILINNKTNMSMRCSKISNKIVQLPNGRHHKVGEDDILCEDPNEVFVINGVHSNIPRRLEWFHLPNDYRIQYRPYNCEQIVLHIIRFIYHKTKEGVSPIFGKLSPSIFFGTITEKQMAEVIYKISKYNLLKDKGEGIKIINKVF